MKNLTINEITRLEIIGPSGRVYTNWNVSTLELSLQDNDRTLKIFVGENNDNQTESDGCTVQRLPRES